MKSTSSAKPIVRQLRRLALALGLWGALVLLFAAPLAFTGRVSWREALRFGGSFWALWLLFLPAVAWLAFRFPLERRRFLRNAGLHSLACLLVIVANQAAFRAVARTFPPAQPSERPGLPTDSKTDQPEAPLQRRRLPPPRPRAPDLATGTPELSSARRLYIALRAPWGILRALGRVLLRHPLVFSALRAALDFLVYWSLVGVGQAITNFRRAQERERRAAELEARFTSAKLQVLRMQINPHFLFNTLNSIAALVYVNPRAADEMLGDLSQLLRRSLDSMEEQEIPLAQELEFIGGYISIEQKRFGERLQVEQSVPDGLLTALVPALILQPLVENAIRHGIEPRRGPGLISIEAKQDENHLHLVVRDNGRGLPDPDLNGSVRRGIGLANTQARLQGLYGQDQSFSFGRSEPQGCRVDIRLPFHFEPVQVPTVPNEPAA